MPQNPDCSILPKSAIKNVYYRFSNSYFSVTRGFTVFKKVSTEKFWLVKIVRFRKSFLDIFPFFWKSKYIKVWYYYWFFLKNFCFFSVTTNLCSFNKFPAENFSFFEHFSIGMSLILSFATVIVRKRQRTAVCFDACPLFQSIVLMFTQSTSSFKGPFCSCLVLVEYWTWQNLSLLFRSEPWWCSEYKK